MLRYLLMFMTFSFFSFANLLPQITTTTSNLNADVTAPLAIILTPTVNEIVTFQTDIIGFLLKNCG
jgi:hypothetical protein